MGFLYHLGSLLVTYIIWLSLFIASSLILVLKLSLVLQMQAAALSYLVAIDNLDSFSGRAIRHPASGYVQGINDLVTPFIIVFLSEYLEGDIDMWDLSKLSPGTILKVSSCYECTELF